MGKKARKPVRSVHRPSWVPYRPRVEAVERRELLATFTVTNNTDGGPGSLRQAILDSNAFTDGPNTIDFNIAAGSIAESGQVPTSGSEPSGITNGPDGNLWFTEQSGNNIGRLTPAGTFTEFPIPTQGSFPDEITTGPDGNLWFTEEAGNQIGRITPSGTITEFPVTTGSDPVGITAGPDGNLWFTDQGNNAIGRITTAGVVTEFPVSTDGGLHGITAGPDGNLWFTDNGNDAIGQITTAGIVTEFPIPTAGSSPAAITNGPDGNLWFTEMSGNNIGRITPTGTITEFPIPTASSDPQGGITTGTDGNLWFTELIGNQVGRITPSGTITEFPIPSTNSDPEGITTGPDGNLWFAEFAANQIGRVTVNAGTTISPASALPNITEAVTIDGYSQPGASVNTLAQGDNAVIPIVLNGTNAGSGAIGLTLAAGSDASTVQGLVVNNFSSFGIETQSNGDSILGNFIGTDATGSVAGSGNKQDGLEITSASNTTIGGTSPSQRNIISGNGGNGIFSFSSSNTTIQGNYIGTNSAGTAALANSLNGVSDGTNASGSTIGGSTPAAANLISGNGGDGVVIDDSSPGHIVRGNLIGTDITGTLPIPNVTDGIDIFGTSVNSTPSNIGGASPGQGNLIAFNGGIGVNVNGVNSITITGNTIRSNVGVGLDLNALNTNVLSNTISSNLQEGVLIAGGSSIGLVGNTINSNGALAGVVVLSPADNNGIGQNVISANVGDGVLVNQATGIPILSNTISANTGLGIDLVNAGNNNQPAPVLTSAVTIGSNTTFTGTIGGSGTAPYTIQFFANPSATNVQGQQFLGQTTVSANGTFTATVSTPSLVGNSFTATATDAGNNTSMFSAAFSSSFVVTNNTDGGPGSLRQAILDSNAATGTSNTIDFNIGVGSVAETPIPTSGSNPTGITTGPDGNLWFTETSSNQIGRITPSGTLTEFPIPTAGSSPEFITNGPDGNLWFTEASSNQIGRITPTGTITEFPISSGTITPIDITTGPDGNLWFTEFDAGRIGRITPSGTVTEFPIPTSHSEPEGITTGPDGNLWFTEFGGGRIGQITPTGTITEFGSPGSFGLPFGITAGPDGNLWFTEYGGNQIGQITPTGTVTEFPIPTSSSNPFEITTAPDGNLWFTEQSGAQIGRITPAGAITEFPTKALNSEPEGITTGPDGNLWFADSTANAIGRVTVNASTTISPASALPMITKPVIIDGYSQPGASVNTLAQGDNAVIPIVLNGSSAGASSVGLELADGSGGSTIQGLVVGGFGNIGIVTDAGPINSGNNKILGNFIGVGVDGTTPLPNLNSGLNINGSTNNIVGTPNPADRNVISGNVVAGLNILGFPPSGSVGDNTIQNNYIGTDKNGTASVANAIGIDVINGTTGNLIGGTGPVEGNLISGNSMDGVDLNGQGTPESGNNVWGNFIGTDVTGANPLPNAMSGVKVVGGASTNSIGGPAPADGNTIAFNGNDGVLIDTVTAVAILSNSIHSNTNLGIELVNNGNNAQAAPILTTAFTSGGNTTINGIIGAGTAPYTIQFFASPSATSTQGQQFLGQTTVSANGTFTATLPTTSLVGPNITATATDAGNNTSMFSAAISSSFVVTNTNDSGPGSLRQAILNVNAATGTPTITFNIPGTGVQTIKPASSLPTITTPVTIDGYSQPGASVNTLANGDNAVLLIELDGENAGVGAIGLTISAGNSTVQGLVINRWQLTNDPLQGVVDGDGIGLQTNGGDTIVGNFIGTDSSGSAVSANQGEGIVIQDASNDTIGGTAPADRNIISGNNDGIGFQPLSAVLTGVLIEGNYIGTDRTGTVALANADVGVNLSDSSGNTIGGTTPGAGNVISGNVHVGVFIQAGSANNLVLGNLIGTDATGTTALGNGDYGVVIRNSPTNTIGGATAADRNVISGNAIGGVLVQDTSTALPPGNVSTGNLVLGNFIGTDTTGTKAVPNLMNGVVINGASGNSIGGTLAGQGNLIAFNGGDGVSVVSSSNNNTILSNTIESNAGNGVTVDTGTGNSILSGTIFANTGLGISLTSNGNNSQVAPVLTAAVTAGGNTNFTGSIGGTGTAPYTIQFFANTSNTNTQGQEFLGQTTVSANGTFTATVPTPSLTGIAFTATATDAANNTSMFSTFSPFLVTNTNDSGFGSLRQAILNADAATGTPTITFAIPGTGVQTISLLSALPAVTNSVTIDGYSQAGSQPNTLVEGDNAVLNIVLDGTNAGSGAFGLELNGPGDSTVQGLVIDNFGYGIVVNSGGNHILGNFIGIDSTGTTARPNLNDGVSIPGSQANNAIGGMQPSMRNVISGNAREGIFSAFAVNDTILNNYVGTNAAGTIAVPNAIGMNLINGSSGFTIGAVGAGNLVSGNTMDGIDLNGNGSTEQNNTVFGNLVGTDATGTKAIPNGGSGVVLASGATNNTIGGATAGQGNTIAFNGATGVVVSNANNNAIVGNTITSNLMDGLALFTANGNSVTSNTITSNTLDGVAVITGNGNPIRSNSIFGSGGLGIRLITDGNNNQPAPVLTTTTTTSGTTLVVGSLQAAANTLFTIELFSSPTPNPSGFGEGQTLVGSLQVTTDATGHAAFSTPLTATVGANQFITATATDLILGPNQNLVADDTSQFSQVTADLTLSGVVAPSGTGQIGDNLTYTFTVANNGPSPAVAAVFTDPLPAGVTFVSASGGASPVNNVVTIPLGTLDRGASTTVTVVVQVGTTNLISNTARVTSATADLLANNSATVSFQPPSHSFIVTNTSSQDIPGSLLFVINEVNADTSNVTDEVTFLIGAGLQSIQPNAQLPTITHPVMIDAGSPAPYPNQVIQLDGSVAGSVADGLVLAGGDSTVRRLTINRFGGAGIVLLGAGHNTLLSNFIGTDISGTIPLGHSLDGVQVNGSSNNVIGRPGGNNIIAANQVGVYLFSGASTNVIQSNLIGFPALNSPMGNTSGGVLISGSNNNLVGGLSPDEGNVIAGNPDYSGVVLFAGSALNVVASNAIVDNGQAGVFIVNSPQNVVGVTGAPNDIAGNLFGGVDIEGIASTSNAVRFNQIVGNAHDGIYIFQAPGNAIGGPGGEGNTILDSGFSGVHIDGAKATRNIVQGNTITDSKGYGILIDDATLNVIGGTGDAANTVQGNAFGGVQVLVAGVPPLNFTGNNTIGTNNGQSQAITAGPSASASLGKLSKLQRTSLARAASVKVRKLDLPTGPVGSFTKVKARRS